MPRLKSVALAAVGLLALTLTAGKPANTHYQDALKEALAKAGGKPVLVDFHAVW